MRSTRYTPLLLLALVAVPGCDAILGPDDDPVSIDVTADTYAFEWVGETTPLKAEVRNKDGDIISNPKVTWSIEDPTVAAVDDAGVLMALANGTTWITGTSGAAVDSAEFTVDSPVPCLPTGTLMVPDTVEDRIVPGDCGPEEPFTEVWQLDVEVTEIVTIDMTSPDFNTALALFNEDGELVATDITVSFSSSILTELTAGTYYILAMPFSVGVGGRYTLSVIEGPASLCPAMAAVSFPDTVTGTTSEAGSCDFDGFPIDVWRFDLTEPTNVTISLNGDAFDMLLVLSDTVGTWLQRGFSSGSASDDWLEANLPAGSYDIWVGPQAPGAVGDYTLKVMQGPSALECATNGSIAIGEVVFNALQDDDCFVYYPFPDADIWFGPAEGWDLVVDDTSDVTFAVTTSDSLFPTILVGDSFGQLAAIGYLGEPNYSRLEATMGPGAYRVWVQSFPFETGEFQMSVVAAGEMSACEPQDTATVDSTYEGALSTTDCALVDGRYADGWFLDVDSATTATIDLTSDKFDTFLIVTDSAGNLLGRDDDSGTDLNSSITLDFDAGSYRVWVTSYAPNPIGGYDLAVTGELGALAGRLLRAGDGGSSTLPAKAGVELRRPRWNGVAPGARGGQTQPWVPRPSADSGMAGTGSGTRHR